MPNFIAKELKSLDKYQKSRFSLFSCTNQFKNQEIEELRRLLNTLAKDLSNKDPSSQTLSRPGAYLKFLKNMDQLIKNEIAYEGFGFWEDLRHARLLNRMLDLEEYFMKTLLHLKAIPEFVEGYNLTIERLYSEQSQMHGDFGACDRMAIDDVPETMREALRNYAISSKDEQIALLYAEISGVLARNGNDIDKYQEFLSHFQNPPHPLHHKIQDRYLKAFGKGQDALTEITNARPSDECNSASFCC